MPLISANKLGKEFRVYKHHRGLLGAFRNLFTSDYNVVNAVNAVSFSIERGELIGLLGPNGAGKSTTIKMLTGILVPSAGELLVDGRVPWRERAAHVREIGVVFGQRTNLWWDLPVIESLDLLRHIYRVPQQRYYQNMCRFQDMLGLAEFLHTPVRSLSLGQRMRADLAAALLHDPKIVFLDEPTIGLDVVAKERIRRFIQAINRERGVTVILTTHDLGDVEKLCQRVLMIDRGRLLFDGALATLRGRFGGERELVVDLADDADACIGDAGIGDAGIGDAGIGAAGIVDVNIAGATLVSREGRRVTYRFGADGLTASELIARVSSRMNVLDLSVREPEIESTLRRIYEGRLLDTLDSNLG